MDDFDDFEDDEDDQELDAITKQSRELLQGLQHFTTRAAADGLDEGAMERWDAQRPRPEPPRRRRRGPTAAELAQLRAGQWETWLRGHLDAERQRNFQLLVQVVAEMREESANELASLRAGFEVQLVALRQEQATAQAKAESDVIDLPPLIRRRRDAA